MIIIASLTVFAATSSAQQTQTSLSADDIKIIRQQIADGEAYKKKYEEEVRAHSETKADRDKWQKSSADWKANAEKETYRADVTQGGRIKELEGAVAEEKKSNFFLRQQSDDDRQKIGEQNFKIAKLKSERKWWFITGFGTGAATGGFAGYQAGKRFGVSVRF
jgi:Skp family chaperone for outer membrane proteins